MVDENVVCPDCEHGLVASSSERGDYFCPDCVTPVNNQKAVFYCVECGEEEIPSHQRTCSNCRDAHEQSHHLSDASRDITWGEDAPDDDLGSFAARDCPGCGVMLIPFNFILQPFHDGEGNYYVGHTCPHCDEILYRSRAADEELADHAKKRAERDPDPPTNLRELPEIEL